VLSIVWWVALVQGQVISGDITVADLSLRKHVFRAALALRRSRWLVLLFTR